MICDSFFFFPQYIFGDFSPDEFNQFFVTPRASVEVRQNFVLLSACIDLIDGYILDCVFNLFLYACFYFYRNTIAFCIFYFLSCTLAELTH